MKTAYEFNKELIQKVKPSMSYVGGDFEGWRTSARAKLCELIGLDKFAKCDPDLQFEGELDREGGKEFRFTFQSEEGYRVPFHLCLPDGVENPPVIITLQGHSTGMHISLGRPKFAGDEETIAGGDRDFARQVVARGQAALTIDQRAFGERGGTEKGPQCFESAMTALLMGRTTTAERVWDIMRLIDLLKSDFADKVDTDCICIMGNSGGGTTTTYVAALEDRIALAMPSCAVSTYKDSIGAMHHCACNYIPHIAEFFDMGDLLCMAAPKPFVQVNGVKDDIFPIEGAKQMVENGKKAYAVFGAEDKLVHVIGAAGHRFYADDAWPVVHKILGK